MHSTTYHCSRLYKICMLDLQGLVVPVIRNAEGMNYADIEKAINALGEKVCLFKF